MLNNFFTKAFYNIQIFNCEKHLKSIIFFGLFVLLSGKIWIEDGSTYRTQVYIWFFLPSLILFFLKSPRLLQYKPTLSEVFLIILSAWLLLRSFETNTSLEHLKILCLVFLFFFAVVQISKEESKFVKLMIITVLVCAAGAFSTIFYQYLIINQDFSYRAYRLYQMGFRSYADFGHPVMAGIYFGFFSVVSLTLILKFNLSQKTKLLLIPATVLLLSYVLLTYSRGAWISVLGCMGLLVLTIDHHYKKNIIFLIVILFASFLIYYRELITLEFMDQGLSGRLQIWKDIWPLIQTRLLSGLGAGHEYLYGKEDLITLQKPTHAHSLYIQIWFEYGLIGLSLYIASISLVLMKTFKILKSSVLTWLSIMGIIFISCNAITDIHSLLMLPGPYWASLFLPIALSTAIIRRYAHNEPAT